MLLQSALIAFIVATAVKADDDVPFTAPSRCESENTKSASSWQSCLTPATAFATCDSDNQRCACSAYTLQQSCYSKYCPGEYPRTSDLEELCLSTPAATSDPFSNTFFHPTSEATARASASDSAASVTSASKATITSPPATSTGGTQTAASASSSTSPNAAPRAAIMPVGGLLAAAAAILF